MYFSLCHTESDFKSESIRFTFSAGLVTDPPRTILGSSLGVEDSSAESTEGFVLRVAIDEASLDRRDVGRVRVDKSLVLVSILDDQGILNDLDLDDQGILLKKTWSIHALKRSVGVF